MLRQHNFVLHNLLNSIYPEIDWVPWKFAKLPKNYDVTIQDQEAIIRFLKEKLNIEDNWTQLTQEVLNYYTTS